jgi:hypothetical protein
MMPPKLRALAMLAAFLPAPVLAQGWTERAGATSASLARDGYTVAAASSQGSPDGRMVLVTFWSKGRSILRCIATIELRQFIELERCEEPGIGR